jgi:hypothetical protein
VVGGEEGEKDKMTLLDRLDSFKAKYYSRTSQSEEPAEDTAFKASDYAEISRKWNADALMTMTRRRELALLAPFFMKATKKKNLDTNRAWIYYEHVHTRKPPVLPEEKIIRDFDIRANTKFKFLIAGICADIYGDGLILKKYLGDWEDRDGKVIFNKPPKGKLVNLELINPEFVKEVKYFDGEGSKQYRKKGIQHFHYVNYQSNMDVLIHPDRVIHVMDDQLPFSKLGISKVDMLRNIIISEGDIDIATGEILKWFSHGVHEMTKEGMQESDKKEILEIMAQHPNFYANSDKWKLEIHNPTAIDPKEFYNYLILGIASVFVMPTQVLLGVQIGKVTGAETGYSDYYRDVKDKQEMIYSPLLHSLYTELFQGHNREFRYDIKWKDIYVGELAEAELMGKRAATIQILRTGEKPIISQEEGREMMNKGIIYLDPSKLPPDNENTVTPGKGSPIIRDEKPKGKEGEDKGGKKETKQSPDMQQIRVMIAAKKEKDALAKLDHELGDEIIKEQGNLFAEEK